MRKYPTIGSVHVQYDADNNPLCRHCQQLVAKGRRFYCSVKCARIFFRNHSWRIVREDVLGRDNFCCRICEKKFRKFGLDIDHIIPVRMGGDPFDKKNLRTLCKECHRAKTKLDEDVLGPIKKSATF